MRNKIISTPDLKKAKERNPEGALNRRINLSIDESIGRYAQGKKFFIHTYGCQANVLDGETMIGMLLKAGFEETLDESEASIIILNTCSVREGAEEKVFGEIGALKKYCKASLNPILAVCGCMVERPEVVKRITEKHKQVRLIFGTHEVPFIFNYLKELIEDDNLRIIAVKSQSGDVFEGLPCKRALTHKAFVNIMYGCNKFCSYCIVPYTRGRERSRKEEDILNEVLELKKQGCKEVTLLGQNVNAYGKDLKDGSSFARLLEKVALTGIERVRFTTSHPWDFCEESIDVIAKYPNIMKCIHLPVQSGSDDILRRMARRYDSKQYKNLVSMIKTKMPECAITTDIIVGFPDESEQDFKDTLEMVKWVDYDSAFTFIYSPRPGTPAVTMEDNVSMKQKHERFDQLVELCNSIVERKAKEMVGKVYKVLVDGVSKTDETMLSGYTETNKLVHFKGTSDLVGQIVNVYITESHAFSLIGEMLEDSEIITRAIELKKTLMDEPLIKEYLRMKELYESDPSITDIRDRVCLAKQDKDYTLEQKLAKELHSHPIYVNFKELENEVLSLLGEIVDYLK